MEYIIYEDSHICVCHKPSGLAVQNASFGRKDLESILKTYYFEQTGKANPYLGIVHRLDQPVQGDVYKRQDCQFPGDFFGRIFYNNQFFGSIILF